MSAGVSAAAWKQGQMGDERVAELLDSLGTHGIHAVHDRWAPDSDAHLDHIVVAPTGVYVVDAKTWSGALSVRDQPLLQNGRRRDEIIDAAIAHRDAIRRL